MSNTGVKTDEKKQHFDDIYVEATPTRILDALSYVSDDFNREMFDAHILPWAMAQTAHGTTVSKSAAAAGFSPGKGKKLNFVDLCSCFGNTTMATVYGMNYDEIRENWKDETACQTIQARRRIPIHITGIDISQPALNYGKSAGLYDEAICTDLNQRDTPEFEQVEMVMSEADILLSTAALVYLDLQTIESIVSSFAGGKGEGMRAGQLPQSLRAGEGGRHEADLAQAPRLRGEPGHAAPTDERAGNEQLSRGGVELARIVGAQEAFVKWDDCILGIE
ncbi:hypothetical protein ACHAXT_006756 [Thalassiosira profunda]